MAKPKRVGPAASKPTSSQREYERFLPAAMALPAESVRPLRVDAELAVVNARRGASAVLEKERELRADLPKLSIARIRSLERLGLALGFAVAEVRRFAPPPSQVRQMLKRASELRALLLHSADALALAGLLNAAAVAKIHRGSGARDVAGDCVALATLFRDNAARLRGKSPVTAEHLGEAERAGSDLLGVIRPRGARRVPPPALQQARQVRDRFWTLFVQTWEDEVWRAGAWLFRRDVDRHVPSLVTRAHRRRAKR
jgi:hypothetical protein